METANRYNLQVENTGQRVVFRVNGVKVLEVDITDVDLIDAILNA